MENEVLYGLFKDVIKEIRGLREDMSAPKVDIITPQQALSIIGANNRIYLTYFTHKKIGLLTRRKGGRGFLYYRSECETLASKIKEGALTIPSIPECMNFCSKHNDGNRKRINQRDRSGDE